MVDKLNCHAMRPNMMFNRKYKCKKIKSKIEKHIEDKLNRQEELNIS